MRFVFALLVLPTLLSSLVPLDASALGRTPWGHPLSEPGIEADRVGDVDGTNPEPRKTLQDTVWIADWSFDTGAPCDDAGWTHVDNHILFTGNVYWHLETGFSTSTGMTGNSFAVGYHDNVCCDDVDGYANDWYQGIRITYTGAGSLSFDYIVDSEASYDYLQIETDSACASYDRVDFDVDPNRSAAFFRRIEAQIDGLISNGEFVNVTLTSHGAGTHCVYIAFVADGSYSPCDGLQPTSLGEGAVIDNIVITDGSGTRMEDFEDGTLDIGTAIDMAESMPFGTWARLFQHITDNDLCTENTTCAWLWTDDTTPTLFNDPSMGFAPGGYVIKGWLDDIIVGPWVSLASTPTASGTVIQFRRFPGNSFASGRVVHNWSVRGKGTVQGQDCVSVWGHAFQWNSLSLFRWVTLTQDMSAHFDPSVEALQIRFRTSDWQWIAGSGAPGPYIPGPGPFLDRVRIGRRVLSGPVIEEGIDSRYQGQDAFPSEIDPNVTPAGEHYRPTTDRFGTCAFSQSADLGLNSTTPNLVTGDSVWVYVQGVRAGGDIITSVTFHGAIVGGPHQGKSPAPYSVGANDFFSFDADSVRGSSGRIISDFYFVDLDDTYFRGGDQLHYFWASTDNGGGYSSDPAGLTAPPASVAEAEATTRGLFEVSYLPTINWDPSYVARIQADPHGDLEPTTQELANSYQATCILYVNLVATRRLSGDINRTSFMYALDRLGYRSHYDVYDHEGLGNTNNHLGGRATVEQAQGYNLIVYDTGNRASFILPDGHDLEEEKIDQAGWFSAWLAQAGLGEAGFATLWLIGSDVLQNKSGVAGSAATLLNTHMGVILNSTDQGLSLNPDVVGVAGFAFDQGPGTVPIDFTGDGFTLNGGCPSIRNYDGAAVGSGTAVATHRYRSPTTNQLGDAAIVMNRNDAEAYNTIMQTHPWFDIRDEAGTPADPSPEMNLLAKILNGVLPVDCLGGEPVDVETGDPLPPPRRTFLYANVPNPFNPTTTIRFDLARDAHVTLRIYDVAGRLVRTLLDEERRVGWDQQVVWNGLDDARQRVSSGVYFCRLQTGGISLTRKLVAMK